MDSKSEEILRTIEEHKELYTAKELERIKFIFSSNKPFYFGKSSTKKHYF